MVVVEVMSMMHYSVHGRERKGVTENEQDKEI